MANESFESLLRKLESGIVLNYNAWDYCHTPWRLYSHHYVEGLLLFLCSFIRATISGLLPSLYHFQGRTRAVSIHPRNHEVVLSGRNDGD